jgi:hypothetical protein
MLLSHTFGLFTHPDQEWEEIRREHSRPVRVYVTYVVLLAAIGPICGYIATAHFGWTVGDDRLIKLTGVSAAQLSILTYAAILVGVFVLGYASNWMARTYGAHEEQDAANGIALSAYSCTPLFLAGFALLYPEPWFNAIVFSAAAAYGAWLMYDGLPIVMGIEKARAVMYGGALLTVALVILVSTLAGSVLLWSFGAGPVFVSG